MIDISKTYRTSHGLEARPSIIEGGTVYGYVRRKDVPGWSSCSWDETTGRRFSDGTASSLDLIEVKPHIKREAWVNVYDSACCTDAYHSRPNADYFASANRIACVKITIDCEHGDGL